MMDATRTLGGTRELDADVRDAMLRELTGALAWLRMAVPGPQLKDRLTEDEDGGEGTFEINLAVYADGRPVFAVVDWMDAYATIVHHPHGLHPEGDAGELAEERCPCCGGIPETASGPDDDGGCDAPNAN